MWRASYLIELLYRASQSAAQSEESVDSLENRELNKLFLDPINYKSTVFDEEFFLYTRVRPPPIDFVSSSPCCAHIWENSEVGRCRHDKEPYNHFCSGHAHELRRAQHRLKKFLEPSAKTSGQIGDIFKFALQRLLIIKKFFRPGSPCERNLTSHLRAILHGQQWTSIEDKVKTYARTLEVSGDASSSEDEESISTQLSTMKLSDDTTKKDGKKKKPRNENFDAIISLTRIVDAIPSFVPISGDVDLASVSFATVMPQWYLFTCRETSYYKKIKFTKVYTHQVSFIVLELEKHVMIVCTNRDSKELSSPIRAWGVFIPVVSKYVYLKPGALKLEDGTLTKTLLLDAASLGNAFVFPKTTEGLTYVHSVLSELIETPPRMQSIDSIVTRFPIQFCTGCGASITETPDKSRPRNTDLSFARNRVPVSDVIRQMSPETYSLYSLEIKLSGIVAAETITSRNWSDSEEIEEKKEVWDRLLEELPTYQCASNVLGHGDGS